MIDQAADVTAYLTSNVIGFGHHIVGLRFDRRVLDEVVDLADVHPVIATGADVPGIHLGKDSMSPIDVGPLVPKAVTEAAISLLVGRRHRNQIDIGAVPFPLSLGLEAEGEEKGNELGVVVMKDVSELAAKGVLDLDPKVGFHTRLEPALVEAGAGVLDGDVLDLAGAGLEHRDE